MWINLGTIIAKKDWKLSQPFSGNLIKIEQQITTLQIGKTANTKLGLISLLIEDQFFSIQQFFSDPQEQIFYFDYLGFDNVQIAIKDSSKYLTADSWNVNIFYWNSLIGLPIQDNQQVALSIQSLAEIQALTNQTITVLGKELIRLKRRLNTLIEGVTPLVLKQDNYWNINLFGNNLLIGNNIEDIKEVIGDEYWNINLFGNDLLIGN